jgi:hypothetical protein
MNKWRAALYFKTEGQAPRKYRLHWAGRCKNGKWKAKLGFWGAMSGQQFWVDFDKIAEVPLGWKPGDTVPEKNVIPVSEEDIPAAEDIMAGAEGYEHIAD